MKLPKEQLIPGRWYYAHIYKSDYYIQFERFEDNGDTIITMDYYYEGKLNGYRSSWGYYKDIDTLEVATELPNGEKLVPEINCYQIY